MTYGCLYYSSALVLILVSLGSIVLASLNLNVLLIKSSTLQLPSFKYASNVSGDYQPFCNDQGFAAFAWLSGYLAIPSMFTGLLAFGVKKPLSGFALFFLIWSALIGFGTSMATIIATSMILYCHVMLSGLVPVVTLLVGICGCLQIVLGCICFAVVCCRRKTEASDLRFGVHPLPDPWELTKSDRILVEANPYFRPGPWLAVGMEAGKAGGGGGGGEEKFPFYGYVAGERDLGIYGPQVVLTGSKEELPAEKRIVLNSLGVQSTAAAATAAAAPASNVRQQIFPAQTSVVKPFAIDRAPQNVYSQHSLPSNCKPAY